MGNISSKFKVGDFVVVPENYPASRYAGKIVEIIGVQESIFKKSDYHYSAGLPFILCEDELKLADNVSVPEVVLKFEEEFRRDKSEGKYWFKAYFYESIIETMGTSPSAFKASEYLISGHDKFIGNLNELKIYLGKNRDLFSSVKGASTPLKNSHFL